MNREGLSINTALKESAMMELGRYFGSNDEPIVLSQSHNHARVVLNRRNKQKKLALT